MQFSTGRGERFASTAGYIVSYGIFTLMLFSIWRFFGKIPDTWSIVHMATLTLIITATAEFVRWVLR
ncbi:MAG TPA: hypothetical protein VJK52_02615 [Candidatus Nanoarchaeia archaeon]|nr:hypothetical protein [Candidatus Nanoarchaeia archaeon]